MGPRRAHAPHASRPLARAAPLSRSFVFSAHATTPTLPYALANAATELRMDKEVVLAAAAQNGHALWYASTELKADKEVVLTAVAQ